MSPFMTREECAAYLRVKPTTIAKWSRLGMIPSRKHGSCLRFYRPEIDAWSERRSQVPKNVSSLSKFQSAKHRLRSLKTETTESHSQAQKGEKWPS